MPRGPDSSPISTPLAHKMLRHATVTKRILDGSERVAFYGPCAPVRGCGRNVSRPVFFQHFNAFCLRSACLRGWRKRGFFGRVWVNCRTGVNCLLTLYLVFALRFSTRYGWLPRTRESHRAPFKGTREGSPASCDRSARARAAERWTVAKGEPAIPFGMPDVADLRLSKRDGKSVSKSAIYR